MRLNVGSAKISLWEKKGLRRKSVAVLHTYTVELMLDEKGQVLGGMVVDSETDGQWQLVEVKQLRQ